MREPGATVKVFDGLAFIGTATVGPDGSWALTPTTPLADGPHSITATGTDPAGNTSAPQGPIVFTVDTSTVVDPVITRALDDVAPQTGVVASLPVLRRYRLTEGELRTLAAGSPDATTVEPS